MYLKQIGNNCNGSKQKWKSKLQTKKRILLDKLKNSPPWNTPTGIYSVECYDS